MRLFLIPRFAEILVLPARPAVQALRCRALTAGESVSAVRRERKRSVSLQKPPQASFQGCQEFIGLINVGGAATEESTAAAAAGQTPGKTVGPLPLARQRPQTFPMGRAEPEDWHSASAGSSGTPNIRPSMTRFARLKEKRCRDSEPSPKKLSGTAPFFRCAPGWLRSDPKIFPTNHRDSTLSSPTAPRGHNRLRYQ